MDFDCNHELLKMACRIRIKVIESIYFAKSGHPGGSLSCVDFLTYLYKKELKINSKHPKSFNRDRFVLSKGHAAPALYAVLSEMGFFDCSELYSLRKFGSFLQGHPSLNLTPGVDVSTGSLGQGISVACGMALGLKLCGSDGRVYCLLGDGELEEGQVWEALLFASHNELDNLLIAVDNNGLQIDGAVESVAGLKGISTKLEAFGLKTMEVDGHSFFEMSRALLEARSVKNRPTAIVLKTKKGKGVSYMEDSVDWHGKAPDEKFFKLAKAELTAALNCLEGS